MGKKVEEIGLIHLDKDRAQRLIDALQAYIEQD
jgi:hypothetical protein